MDDITDPITKLTEERRAYANCRNGYDTLYAQKKTQLLREGAAKTDRAGVNARFF